MEWKMETALATTRQHSVRQFVTEDDADAEDFCALVVAAVLSYQRVLISLTSSLELSLSLSP